MCHSPAGGNTDVQERGFQAVGLEDIGAAAGIAGTGVYKYFAGKTELPATVVQREGGALWFALDQALILSSSPARQLGLDVPGVPAADRPIDPVTV
ncbi:TetR family transcriptional regulator [Streptomyces sp. NPDC005506]|uniref:TetR family transcriptional regulator n=1 Tax=unclassified Streptomyces TaxID=2593676 RepID=UPI0036BDB609